MAPETSYTRFQPVPPSVAHRRSAETAYVRSLRRLGEDEWEIRAARDHHEDHLSRARAAVEIVRQAGVAVAHIGCGVPLDNAFAMQDLHFEWLSASERRTLRRADPLELNGLVRVTERTYRRDELSGVRVEVHLDLDNAAAARGGGLMLCLQPRQFRAVRRNAPQWKDVEKRTDPIPLRAVQIEDRALTAQLGWNVDDPVAFDHPLDHVPGLVLADAALWSAHLLGIEPSGFRLSFSRFTEFASPAAVVARQHSRAEMSVSIHQDGSETMPGVVLTGVA